jgi:hypothetical protein
MRLRNIFSLQIMLSRLYLQSVQIRKRFSHLLSDMRLCLTAIVSDFWSAPRKGMCVMLLRDQNKTVSAEKRNC